MFGGSLMKVRSLFFPSPPSTFSTGRVSPTAVPSLSSPSTGLDSIERDGEGGKR